MPPKSRNSTLVAVDAEASKVAVPDSVAPVAGISTLVVGGGRPAGPSKAWIWVEDGARISPSAAEGEGNDDTEGPIAKCWISVPFAGFNA